MKRSVKNAKAPKRMQPSRAAGKANQHHSNSGWKRLDDVTAPLIAALRDAQRATDLPFDSAASLRIDKAQASLEDALAIGTSHE